MPHFVESLVVPAAVDVVFAFFRAPANLLLLAPPELHLEIVAAPQQLELGSRVELKGRRWGIAHRSTLEITALAIGKLLVEEQRAGPFRQWKHEYRFEALGEQATRLTDEVTFEPPGGMLGFIVTTAFVQRELTAAFQFRKQRLLELLGAFRTGGVSQATLPPA